MARPTGRDLKAGVRGSLRLGVAAEARWGPTSGLLHQCDPDTEHSNRLAIRELFDGYAHCADRRLTEGQKAPLTEAMAAL
jgi:hypothetical protein